MLSQSDFFSGEHILSCQRALLRPLNESDLSLLLPFALGEPELWIFSLVSPAGHIGMKEYIATALQEREHMQGYPFLIIDKRTGKAAGCTRFYDVQWKEQTMQLGYTWLGRQYQLTGLNRHCKFLLLHWAFEVAGMHRIELRADARNARSIAAMKSIGCTEEGILREHLLLHSGQRRSSMVLSILREEWFSEKKEALRALISRKNI